MLLLSILRNNPEEVKQKLSVKNFKSLHLVDDILSLDIKKRQVQMQSEKLASDSNQLSKQIGQLMMQKKDAEANELKNKINNIKNELKDLQTQLESIETQLNDMLVQLPNLPSALVPKGIDANDNTIVKTSPIPTHALSNPLPHWDLVKKYNLIDFELGTKITGSGFPFYIGNGAKLVRSLIQFFLDYNIAAGYTEYLSPLLVNEATAYGTGQLPDKEGQMYAATKDNFYLIPTAEVPLTNIYRDDIIAETQLPIKMTGYTPCFRREAGSYGKDVKGLNRLHQFDKVEIVQITYPQESYNTLDTMVNHVEKLLQQLQLPYRILRLCGGDMSFASALTYDFEVYSIAQQRWLEVSSVSNFETFQTNRMKIRYKDKEGKINLLHSLNGSSLALPRIIAALLEQYQTQDNITIPQALVPYFGKTQMI